MHSFSHIKFITNLKQQTEFTTNSSILLAISYGQDSLCLLKLFLDLKKKYKFKLGIIHIDHQWRDDTIQSTKHLVNMIKDFNINSYIYQLNPYHYSEIEFRNLRYQIFLDTANTYSYDYIATAHTATDKAETCIRNLFHSSNFDGLNSLLWLRSMSTSVKIVRPILNFTRAEVKWFCHYYILPIWFDYTNIYYKNYRNRLRHEIIPYIKHYYGNDIEIHINQLLDNIYLDSEYLRQSTLKVYLTIRHSSFIALNHTMLLQQHKALQARVLHLFFLHNTNLNVNYLFLMQLIVKVQENRKSILKYKDLSIKNNNNWLYLT
uniref:tRNA Ile-lysidine synthetase n=1 Tax=Nemalion vermiculare TaxID=935621 RepID=UPI0025802E7A|nr:tRNA Ile-lysidine synthetase [Nemalion vermiculare]WGV34348.1 tRNA Ile-lysidine synthetase [Nemalion vermiculare]